MLTMLTNDDLKKLRNLNIKDMSIFQTIIATALIIKNTVLARINILTLIIYCEVVEDLV